LKLNLVERNGLLLPAEMAVEIGFGCPKHDDHVLVPTRLQTVSPEIQAFLKKHADCGKLETLEKRADGEVGITGRFPSD
jgi:hypothetical protein